MRPSSLLRLLSTKPSPSTVAPWPPVRSAFDRWLAAELDELHLLPLGCARYTGAQWLSQALDLAAAAQVMAGELLRPVRLSAADRKLADAYLADVVELLDACNGVRERMADVDKYAASLATAAGYLEGKGIPGRASAALSACEAMERRCAELEKCGSNLRKLGERIAASDDEAGAAEESELCEALRGARALAVLAVSAVGVAVSFKTRRGVPAVQSGNASSSWRASWGAKLHDLQKEVKEEFEKRRRGGSVVMDELEAAARSAARLREAIARRDGARERAAAADAATRRGRELEARVRPLGAKVDGLYRRMIGIRVALLGKLTEGYSSELRFDSNNERHVQRNRKQCYPQF